MKSRPVPEVLDPETSPTAHLGLEEARAAFAQEDANRARILETSPVMAFLDRHEDAGSPNELTITGVADVKVTLGDLRKLVKALK